MSRRLRLSLVLAAAAAVVVAVALLASGAFSSAGSGSDPAKAVPPSAAVYAYAELHPGGEAGTSMRHVLGHVLGDGDDPGPRRRRLADAALGRVGLSYDRDIAPWVGSRLGVFVTRFGPRLAGAVAAGAKDPEAPPPARRRTRQP